MRKMKSGFTLVELLATIIILGILVGIVSFVAINAGNKGKEKSYQVTVNQIEKTAYSYLMENKERLFFLTNVQDNYEYQCVMVENLIDYGYLDSNIVNSNVAKDVYPELDDYVYIERDINNKAITKSLYTKKHPEYAEICNKAVIAQGDIYFTASPDFNEWSKSKEVIITYRIDNLNDVRTLDNYIYDYTYSGNALDDSSKDTFANYTKKKTITVTSNGQIDANIKYGNDLIATAYKIIDKIDTVRPKIELGDYKGSMTVRQMVTLPLKLVDDDSGINHSSFTKEDLVIMVGDSNVSDFTLTKVNETDYNLVINSDLYNGKIIINIASDKILDNAGNGNLTTTIDTDVIFDNTYVINYDANGGSGAPSATRYLYATSGTISLSSAIPVRDGYSFLGWSTNSSATTATYASGGSFERNIKKDVTLYALWAIMSWSFEYTGSVQTFSVPYDGQYKLEAYGAQGGSDGHGTGGKGGYSYGYINLKRGTNLYIVVGGSGTTSSGGYNGGGKPSNGGGGGGGATHIATISGVLSSLSNNKNKVLIVAGGGGGAAKDTVSSDIYEDGGNYFSSSHNGGSGGGYNGGKGGGNSSSSNGGSSDCGAAVFFSYRMKGMFGQGGSSYCCCGCGGEHIAGGGGGWCGGDSGDHLRSNSGGGGGSGYIGGVSNASTSNGVRTGHGRVIITFNS